jgi:hypothetical protein
VDRAILLVFYRTTVRGSDAVPIRFSFWLRLEPTIAR